MKKLQLLVVAASCAALFLACSKEDKKEAAKTPEQGEAAKADPAAATAAAATPGPSAGHAGLAGLGALLGGKKVAPPAAKGGGGLLGGLGLGGGAAAPTPTATGEAAPAATPAVEKPAATPVAPPAAAGAAPGCQKVAEHVGKILEQEMTKAKAQGLDMEIPPEMVDQMKPMVAMVCQQMNWSAEAQACVLSATDSASIDKCQALMPDSMGDVAMGDTGGMDMGDVELPDMSDVPSTPVPSGDAECDRLAVTLLGALLSELPADQKRAIEPMKVTLHNEIAKECASTPWPKPVRACLSQAKNQADMEKCASQM